MDGKAPLPLEEKLYYLTPDEKEFFVKTTGISDDEELKKHILAVQKKAYTSFPYPCIRLFTYLRLTVTELEGYRKLLKLADDRAGAIFVDIGCGLTNVTRKAVFDGFPVQNVVASDLNAQFWEFGHELFRTTPETFPVPFIPGDIFSAKHLTQVPPFTHPPTEPRPDLTTLISLNSLRGHASAIHAAAFFHLFSEEKQVELACKFAGLLSPEPGSIMFGDQIGLPEQGWFEDRISGSGWKLFSHSPESWKALWDGMVFPKGTVEVHAVLSEVPVREKVRLDGFKEKMLPILQWCVTRL
ncbi:hypothetical protein EVG20_g7083 [Dentipellis fragilis]|uniref:Methyltransferase domain-containing protein n=1 Tax=Dentipellis fragilis TaxID=205917 RepID=A0A4Y9YKB4_9AGAM|nr:hypothetical protein EVG20_g7083 [Dentipellis fragilis]